MPNLQFSEMRRTGVSSAQLSCSGGAVRFGSYSAARVLRDPNEKGRRSTFCCADVGWAGKQTDKEIRVCLSVLTGRSSFLSSLRGVAPRPVLKRYGISANLRAKPIL
jgi:hypothetical protein